MELKNEERELSNSQMIFNCKMNTTFFHDEIKENINDLTRVGYVSVAALINHKILNKSWMVISNDYASTLIYIIANEQEVPEDDQNAIYLHAAMLNLLKITIDKASSKYFINLSDYFDKIPSSHLKYKFVSEESKIQNLPQAKRIKVKRLGKCNEQSDAEIKKYFQLYSVEIKEDIIISSNQILLLCDTNKIVFDLFYGIFTNKNNFYYYYQIIDIEYEQYDSLRSLIKSDNSNNMGIFNTAKESRHTNLLDAFVITGRSKLSKIERDIEIEIIKDDYNNPCLLPNSNLNFLNNYLIKSLARDKLKEALACDENKLEKDIKSFRILYDRINSDFFLFHVVFLIAPLHTGVNYIMRKISDENGLHYYTKDMKKFKSIENFIEYLKKIEFRTPCVVNFKNAKRFSEFISEKQKSGGTNYINEIKNILYLPRGEKNSKIFYYFSFGNSTEIDNSLKSLPGINIDHTLPDLNTRTELIHLALNNMINNYQVTFNKHFVENANTILKLSIEKLKADILLLNNYNISKLLVGFDLKDIKSFFKLSFENYIESNRQSLKKSKINKLHSIITNPIENISSLKNYIAFDFELIKQTYNKIKQSRLKSEKSISSIPEIKWDNVGGLEHAKEDINDTIQLPIKYPKLFKNSLKRRSGLLLYGPPGSGKTLLAKAIANECSMNFISVKGPELLNMYVGESEKNIREVFERGRGNKPCVLFFDEIDALAPARAKNSDQNNVMDRIVAQFMTEMDGLIKADDLILIASTNRPDLIDPSLLRPGRFDKMIYVGLPKTVEEKFKIFQAQTGKLNLAEDVDFMSICEKCPEDYSGADIFAVCSKAFTLSLKEKIRNLNVKSEDIVVNMKHFCESIKQIQPSLAKSEILKYEELKKKYSNQNK